MRLHSPNHLAVGTLAVLLTGCYDVTLKDHQRGNDAGTSPDIATGGDHAEGTDAVMVPVDTLDLGKGASPDIGPLGAADATPDVSPDAWLDTGIDVIPSDGPRLGIDVLPDLVKPEAHPRDVLDGNGQVDWLSDAFFTPTDAAPAEVGSATCAQVMNQAECDTRSECHSVFVDPQTCGCAAAGCCARFDRCASGGLATCTAPASLCLMMPPFCEEPYAVAYTNNCYEGCVNSIACAR